MSAPPPRTLVPIRFKLGFGAAILAVVPLAVAGWLVFLSNRDALAETSTTLQLGVAEDLARTLMDEVDPVTDTLRSIAMGLVDTRIPPETRVAVARSMISGSRALVAVGIYGTDGIQVDRILEKGAKERATGALTRAPSARVQTRARQQGFSLDTIVNDMGGVQIFATVAMWGDSGELKGFVVGEIPLNRVQVRLARLVDETFVDEIEEAFVVDRSGPVVAQRSRIARTIKSADDLEFLRGTSAEIRDKDVLQSGPFVDVDGTPRFGGLVARSGSSWAVVVQTSQARAFAPVTRSRNIVIATLASAAILALLFGMLLARRFSRPIEVLATMARSLAKRDFDARVDVKSADEFGLLGTTMNETAQALREGENKLIAETEVRNDIARYLPQELVDAVVAREHDLRLGGTRRRIVVLFADVVAFTPLAETLEPEKTVALLNELFTYLTEMVFRHHGTVDKFIGDSVMALFGVPHEEEDDVIRAIACAEEMLQWLEVGNATWRDKYGTTIRLAIGVNVGEAVVGNIGTERRMEFTAIGRTVNLAARLESVARPQQILVTEDVVKACAGTFSFRPLGEQPLGGNGGPVEVFALETT